MLETVFSFQVCIGTSCPCLLRGGFFVVGVLVVVCGCGERITRSTVHNRQHDEVGSGLSWIYP